MKGYSTYIFLKFLKFLKTKHWHTLILSKRGKWFSGISSADKLREKIHKFCGRHKHQLSKNSNTYLFKIVIYQVSFYIIKYH